MPLRLSNLTTRTLSSIAFVVLILGPLFISSRTAFAVYAFLGAFTLNEIFRLNSRMGTTVNTILGVCFYTALIFLSYGVFFMPEANLGPIFMVLACLFLGGLVAELFGSSFKPLDRISTTLFAPIYVSASFLALPYFFHYRSDLNPIAITIAVFALIWINDAGAYLIGRKLGRTKLFPRLSPNKTWEGSLGGLFCALLAGAGLHFYLPVLSIGFTLGFAFVCVAFGSLGDLFESRMKRAAQVKDSGRFLPGHGGFFDRFDAMMFAVPASIIYFEAFLPKP